MAYTAFIKHFNDIKGIDQNANPINRDETFAESLTNAQYSDNNDLEIRKGQRIAEGSIPNLKLAGRNGILPYSYSDANGQAVEELITYSPMTNYGSRQGDSVFQKRFEGTLRITYTGAVNASASFLPDGSGNLTFTLKANGVTVLTQGMNQPDVGVRLETLRLAINAIANFTCVLTPWGLVQTAGGALGKTADLVLQAGHTISVGDSIALDSNRDQARVTYVLGNNIRWNTLQNDRAFANGDVLGIGREYGGNLECFPETTWVTGESIQARVTYWGPVYGEYGHDEANLFNAGPMNSAVILDNMFIGIPSYSYTQSIRCGQTVYDGQRQYRSGLPQTKPPVLTASAIGGSMTASSTYQYFYTLQYKNARGQIIESRRSLASSVTLGAGDNSCLLNIIGTQLFWDANEEYPSSFGQLNAAAASTTTHPTVAGQYIQPGDFLYFFDTATGRLAETKCTGATNAAVFWSDGLNVTVNPATYPVVSGGLVLNVWRTKANGSLFYLTDSLPVSRTYNGPFSFRNTTADSGLTVEYIDPPIGSEKDPPPFMRYVANHQGLLVGCNGVTDYVPNQTLLTTSRVKTENPNTAFYSLADGPWYFPAAYNAFDVPPGVTGTLSAIATDTTSRLAIFKELAIYEAVGDLSTGAFSLETVSEGDVGCLSHTALVRIKEALIFPSAKGFRLLANGQLEAEFSRRLLPAFARAGNASLLRSSGLQVKSDGVTPIFSRAIGINDYKQNRYICTIPVSSTVLVGNSVEGGYNANSKIYVYDYLRDAWFDWTVGGDENNWGGGMAYYKGRFCTSSFAVRIAGRPSRFMERMETGDDLDYADYTMPIKCDWKFAHFLLGDASINKSVVRIRVWQFKHGTNFTYARYQDFRDYVTASPSTDCLLTFGSPTSDGFNSISQDAKLRPGKFLSLQPVLSNKDLNGSYFTNRYFGVSGIEIVVRVTYDKEDVI